MDIFLSSRPSQVWLGILGAVLTSVFLGLFYLTPLRRARMWTIIVTPLASIIGSGFLVVAPLLYSNFGRWSLPAILMINGFALAIGFIIRTNIVYFEPLLEQGLIGNRFVLMTERLSNAALGISYVISIAFYLNLLSSFALELFDLREPLAIRLLTTVLLAFIGVFGFLRGLHGLEALEKIAVNSKLSIIGALVVVLAVANIQLLAADMDHAVLDTPPMEMRNLQVLGGMLLIVQGFETARYLGRDYSRQERARALLLAQLIAAGIYILFVALAQPFSMAIQEINEVAIIEIVGAVAIGLPLVLSLAAIFSQFGAGVADTVGTGGIIEEETLGRVSRRVGYLIVVTLAILLIWVRDIFEVLTLASRAFAAYYGLQAVIAVVVTYRQPRGNQRSLKLAVFPVAAICLFLIAGWAIPAH